MQPKHKNTSCLNQFWIVIILACNIKINPYLFERIRVHIFSQNKQKLAWALQNIPKVSRSHSHSYVTQAMPLTELWDWWFLNNVTNLFSNEKIVFAASKTCFKITKTSPVSNWDIDMRQCELRKTVYQSNTLL